ncbi:MAG: hypothetical protein KDJ29_06900 [Hyphomicrobiales bacterium]|nr:hypothetical protein [Hyphomicrobiales bacterium]
MSAKAITQPLLFSGRRSGSARVFVAGLSAAMLLAGCSVQVPMQRSVPQPAPGSAIRQSIASAPADLQLLCATRARERFAIARGDVFPVDSRAAGVNAYEVDLKYKGGRLSCIIDKQANVQRLVRL